MPDAVAYTAGHGGYDLILRLLETARAAVERVAISRLHEETFYATLVVRVNGQTHEIDARPSDALNLALRIHAPIFVAAEVMEAQAVRPEKLSAKLAADQSRPDEDVEWASVQPPDLHAPPPTEK